ncbi:hypothetical protein PoB_000941400 [Plakobranchus ocellatus]|uniref:Uncharacterized protein n=1 Tax=Plakobranchus ocellatus TaxID=259542 RepID=A0AAV3YL96_9GAST|nr:hypothetical protein PoB_000941400 [Plakobranchus ocellatus]
MRLLIHTPPPLPGPYLTGLSLHSSPFTDPFRSFRSPTKDCALRIRFFRHTAQPIWLASSSTKPSKSVHRPDMTQVNQHRNKRKAGQDMSRCTTVKKFKQL